MKAKWAWLNGEIVRRAEASVSPFDRGFLYGDGFFETLRAFGGAAFLLREHIDRLNASCRETGWRWCLDAGEAADAVSGLLARNGMADAYLRITVSRGSASVPLTELQCAEPTVLIEVRDVPLPPLDAPPNIALAGSPYRRNERSPVVRHKSLSYQFNLMALAEGRGRGADEVFFLNPSGCLTEGAISNLFFVRDGALYTPAVECGLLPGVTRAAVIDLARNDGLEVSCGRYFEDDLRRAEEIFCTNSLRGIMGVERIVDYPELGSCPGPTTARLQALYAEQVRRACGLS